MTVFVISRAEGGVKGKPHQGHQSLRQLLQKGKKERKKNVEKKKKNAKAVTEEPEGPIHEHS